MSKLIDAQNKLVAAKVINLRVKDIIDSNKIFDTSIDDLIKAKNNFTSVPYKYNPNKDNLYEYQYGILDNDLYSDDSDYGSISGKTGGYNRTRKLNNRNITKHKKHIKYMSRSIFPINNSSLINNRNRKYNKSRTYKNKSKM